MSTDRQRPAASRRARNTRRRTRAFLGAFGIVIAALAVLGATGALIGIAIGPRVTSVQVDPAAAIATSGSRLIVTTTQSLAQIDPSQVSITPAVAFDVDTSGRSIGIRFTEPLDDDTDYTVTVRDVRGVAGGPMSTVSENFRTPSSSVFILQRGTADGDTIFRTDLTGLQAVAVFAAPHIEDFRATASHLVVWMQDGTQTHVVVTGLDGSNPTDLRLPGAGSISQLQIADRGERIGYLFTQADLSAANPLESALFTASVSDPDAEPTRIAVAGADGRIAQWTFVPDTDAVLLRTFDGSLLLTAADGSSPTAFGTALAIDGISPGTGHAIIERIEGLAVLDLETGQETPLVAADDAPGQVGSVLPLPDGGTLRTVYPVGSDGHPTGATSLVRVSADGATRGVFASSANDAVLQTCVSPSGQYAAVLVAPEIAGNRYDAYQLPLPQRVQTHIVAVGSGDDAISSAVVTLAGSAISWCPASAIWG